MVQTARRIDATSQMLKSVQFPVRFCHVLSSVAYVWSRWVLQAYIHKMYANALVIFIFIDHTMSAFGVAFRENLYLIVDLSTHQK